MPEDKLRAPGRPLAWIAESLLPTRAARSATSFPTGTISSTAAGGREGDRPAARDQQLSGIHRQDLSCSMRRSLRPQHQQRSRHDQTDREKTLSIMRGRKKWIEPLPVRAQIRQARRGRRFRDRQGSPARSNSPRAGHSVTLYERSDRVGGLLHLRNSGLQAGKVDRKSTRRADEGRGSRNCHQLPRRHRYPC